MDEKKREGFIFYRSFWEAVKNLPLELRDGVVKALVEFGLDGVEPSGTDPVVRGMFELIKPQLEANNRRYENGKKGGRPRKTEKEPNENQNKTEKEPNNNQSVTEQEPKEKEKVNDKVKDKVNDKENDGVIDADASAPESSFIPSLKDLESFKEKVAPKRKVFQKPTIEQVREYVQEMGYTMRAEDYFDYYESNGWKVGKNAMKDWKASVRNWNRMEKNYNKKSDGTGFGEIRGPESAVTATCAEDYYGKC